MIERISVPLGDERLMPHSSADKEVSLLELLRDHPDAAQRDMAEAIGLSLGMTNLLLKTLSARGWMMMSRLSSKKMLYVLTPEGMKELSRRSYRYLKRTIRSVAECRVLLEALVLEAKGEGARGLHLLGSSEIDFVLESVCRQHDFPFRTSAPPEGGWRVVFGEDQPQQSPNVLDYLGGAPGEAPLR